MTTDDRIVEDCTCRGSFVSEIFDSKTEIYEVFPNPVTHTLYVNDASTTISDIKIYNVLDELVSIPINSVSLGHQLDVSSLNPGIYTIHIAQKSSLRVIPDLIFRFVKQ